MPTLRQVAARAGVSTLQLLRWDHRYRVTGSPTGLAASLDDPAADRLLRMCELVAQGMEAAEAARTAAATDPPPTAPAYRRSELVAAARAMDVARLDDVLARGLGGDLGERIDGWLMPQLRLVGDGWAAGELTPTQEEFCSAGVMAWLYARLRTLPGAPPDAPVVLVGLPPGEVHEIPALALAVLLRAGGLRVEYLGPNVAVATWVAAVRDSRPAAVVQAARSPQAARSTGDVFAALRTQGTAATLWVGGAYADRVRHGRVAPDSLVEAARTITAAARAVDPVAG